MKRLVLFLILAALTFSMPVYAAIGTLQSQTIQYGNGSQTQFYGSFPVVSASDVQVVYTNTTGQQSTLLPTQYLITIYPPVTGQLWSTSFSVSYPLIGSPIAAGTSLTISRVLPLTQGTVLSNQGAFYPQVVEAALDTNVMQLQQVSARTGQLRGSWVTGIAYNFGDIVVDGTNGNNTGNIYTCANSNTSSTWTADLASGYWSLALNVQGIIHTSTSISNNQVMANISGSSTSAYGVGVSALLDSVFGTTQGDILYRGSSLWSALAPGTSGYVLTTQGASANPQWLAGAGSGTITGVTPGAGLVGGGTSGNVTLGLSTQSNNTLLANTSGGTASPSATTVSTLLDSVFGSTQGAILYRAGTAWTELAPGTSGQVLQTQGASANPQWTNNGFTSCTQATGSGTGTTTATCAGGYTMTGGGCSNSSGGIYASVPGSSTSWFCGGGGSVSAYAICCH